MRITWLISSVITFILGVLFIKALWWILIGIIIGFPLILLSIIIFLLGLILPSQRKIINIQKNYYSNTNNKNNNLTDKKPEMKKAKVVKEKKINKK